MNKNEITNLIDEVITKVSMQVGKSLEIIWDGGQDGGYYIEDITKISYEEFKEIDNEIDILSSQVRKFLIENDLQESDLWEIEELKRLEGQEMTLLKLSNELELLGYEDIFDLNLNEILEHGNIVIDNIQISFSNITNKEDLLKCRILIDKVEKF